MTWSELHSRSERLASKAQLLALSRKRASAGRIYRQAAEFERQALEVLDASKSRTRGATAVSAVALYYKGGDYETAERLACAVLADSAPVPEFARAELQGLLQAVWNENAKKETQVRFLPGQISVSVKGGRVVTGGAPLDLVVEKEQAIRSFFYRYVEHRQGVPLRLRGGPPKEVREYYRPWVFQGIPHGYDFSVAIERSSKWVGYEAAEVASDFLLLVGTFAAAKGEEMERLVPDKDYRNAFLTLTRNLAPAGGTFDTIELRASGDVHPVALGTDSRRLINKWLRSNAESSLSPGEKFESLRGILRAVNLDDNWLEITSDDGWFHIEGLEEVVDDVISPMVNRSVHVTVLRTRRRKLKFVDIELAD